MHIREISGEVQVMCGGKMRMTGLLQPQCSGCVQPALHRLCRSSNLPFCELLMQKIGTDFGRGWEGMGGREVNLH
jgi:hypothetical protein